MLKTSTSNAGHWTRLEIRLLTISEYIDKPKLHIVTGISGSGKTTVARQLLERGEVAFDSKLAPGYTDMLIAKVGSRNRSICMMKLGESSTSGRSTRPN